MAYREQENRNYLLYGIAAAGVVILYFLFFSGSKSASPEPNIEYPKKAICVLNNAGIEGTVTLIQETGEKTKITASIKGLSKGAHGFHIHQFGNLSQGCLSAGPHYNPFKKNHGSPKSEDRHVGDLGNIQVEDSNAVQYTIEDHLVKLHGSHSVIGRAIVIHADTDDFGLGGHSDSLTTGHAGARLACCIIGEA